MSVLETNVIVTAHSESNDVISNSVEITFHPALFYDEELVLDDDSFSADLLIVGSESVLNDVTVRPKLFFPSKHNCPIYRLIVLNNDCFR